MSIDNVTKINPFQDLESFSAAPDTKDESPLNSSDYEITSNALMTLINNSNLDDNSKISNYFKKVPTNNYMAVVELSSLKELIEHQKHIAVKGRKDTQNRVLVNKRDLVNKYKRIINHIFDSINNNHTENNKRKNISTNDEHQSKKLKEHPALTSKMSIDFLTTPQEDPLKNTNYKITCHALSILIDNSNLSINDESYDYFYKIRSSRNLTNLPRNKIDVNLYHLKKLADSQKHVICVSNRDKNNSIRMLVKRNIDSVNAEVKKILDSSRNDETEQNSTHAPEFIQPDNPG